MEMPYMLILLLPPVNHFTLSTSAVCFITADSYFVCHCELYEKNILYQP